MCQCIMCFNKATHISRNSELALCDECYTSFEDEYETTLKKELRCSFDEYYDFEVVDVNSTHNMSSKTLKKKLSRRV